MPRAKWSLTQRKHHIWKRWGDGHKGDEDEKFTRNADEGQAALGPGGTSLDSNEIFV